MMLLPFHPLFWRRTINIICVQFIAVKFVLARFRSGPLYILDIHSIPNKLRRRRIRDLVMRQFVLWVERISDLSICLELQILRFGSFDVFVHQGVELSLHFYVERARLRTLYILILIKQLPCNFPWYLDPRLGSMNVISNHIGARHSLSSDAIL